MPLGESPVEAAAEPGDERFTSVTTALGVLDKPALPHWSAIETAKAAVEERQVWQPICDRHGVDAAVDWLKRARFRKPPGSKYTATELGQLAHEACAVYALEGRRPDVDREIQPFVIQWERLCQEFQPEFLACEYVVYSPLYGVAGQVDGAFKLDGAPYIFDYKTSRDGWDSGGKPKAPYPEVSLQLAAYRYAELAAIWRPRRFEQFSQRYYLLSQAERDQAVTPPVVDGGMAIHLSPHRYAVHPVACGPDEYRSFLYVLEVARWKQGNGDAVRPALIPPFPLEG